MMHRVYTRDWYYNAGIVGFLRVISDDALTIEDLKNSQLAKDGLIIIGDNYIEFDSSLLEGFRAKFMRMVFLHLFRAVYLNYHSRIESCLKVAIQNEENRKTNPAKKGKSVRQIKTDNGLNGKVISAFFDELGYPIETVKDNDLFIKRLKEINKEMNELNPETFYDKNQGGTFIPYFLETFLEKRLVSLASIEKYLESIRNYDYSKNIKSPNGYCLSCQERGSNKGFELNNSISNVIAFNKDNANWIWGYNTSNLKLCGVCALIYSCAVLAFVSINKGQEQYWYMVNHNGSIALLYSASQLLLRKFRENETQNQPFNRLIRELTIKITQEQAGNVRDNIHFVEMAESEMGGQSSRAYHVYNYTVSPELADFIAGKSDSDIPKGGYKINDIYFNIAEELIKKTIMQQLAYQELWRYFNYMVRRKDGPVFNLYQCREYIFSYINHFKGGNAMRKEAIDLKKVSAKAYANGKKLREKIIAHTQNEKKIKGIAYQILNDLKISDREKFLDIYTRLMMSYDMDIAFGSNQEMTDTDAFLQFGYSFLNGLLARENSNSTDKGENNG